MSNTAARLPLNIAIVGCGDVAYRHYLPALEALRERVRITAVVDARPDAAAGMSGRVAPWSPNVRAYPNIEAMLSSTALDGAFNLTPAPAHGSVNEALLSSEIPTYSEKPIASSLAQADELIALAATKAVLLMCAPGSAVSGRIRWLRSIAESGRFGRPTLVVAHHADPGPADWLEYTGDPTPFYQEGVGPVFDHGVYRLHEMTTVLGPVKRVQAMGSIALPQRLVRGGPLSGRSIEVTTQDHVLMQLEFESGALGQLLASFATADTLAPWLEMHFERGVVSFGGKSWEPDAPVSIFDATNGADGSTWQNADDAPVEADVVEAGATHFINCLLGIDEPVLTAAHARHVLEIILAAYDSMESRCAVDVTTRF